MRRRKMRDSQNIYEVCVILLLFTVALIVLVDLSATAIDQALTEEVATLDEHLSPAQRALNAEAINATTLSQQAVITAELERNQ